VPDRECGRHGEYAATTRLDSRWSVEWTGDDKPKVSAEQEALQKKYTEGLAPGE
jgi:hypothetical protein